MNRQAIALLGAGHALIDLCQGMVPALVPFFVTQDGHSYAAAASLVLAASVLSSVVQPLFGYLADRGATPWLLPASVAGTGLGLAVGCQSSYYPLLFSAIGLSGLGVAAFHPEAARTVYRAAGARRTGGMSIFSVGGSVGFTLAPVLTMPTVLCLGRPGLLLLLLPTLLMTVLLMRPLSAAQVPEAARTETSLASDSERRRDAWGWFAVLSAVVGCRSVVFVGLNTFLALYWMKCWGQSERAGAAALAVFMATGIAGTLLGGWLGDRYGRRFILRVGSVALAGMLTLFTSATSVEIAALLLVPLGLALFVAASGLMVLGQEYLPNRVGTASGVTIGLAISVGGLVAPLLGRAADLHGVKIVPSLLLGVSVVAGTLAFLLPSPQRL